MYVARNIHVFCYALYNAKIRINEHNTKQKNSFFCFSSFVPSVESGKPSGRVRVSKTKTEIVKVSDITKLFGRQSMTLKYSFIHLFNYDIWGLKKIGG